MRRRITIAGVAIAVLFFGWLIDNQHGAALDVGDGSLEVSAPVAGRDVDVYFIGPALRNKGGTSIELVRIEPVTASEGLSLAEAQIYRRDDFPMGGVPATWSNGDGDIHDPTKLPSEPLRGYELGGKQELDVMLIRLHISTDQRPLTMTGLRVIYRNGFRDHSQIVNMVYTAN